MVAVQMALRNQEIDRIYNARNGMRVLHLYELGAGDYYTAAAKTLFSKSNYLLPENDIPVMTIRSAVLFIGDIIVLSVGRVGVVPLETHAQSVPLKRVHLQSLGSVWLSFSSSFLTPGAPRDCAGH
jgi:hypothetical protein